MGTLLGHLDVSSVSIDGFISPVEAEVFFWRLFSAASIVFFRGSRMGKITELQG